MDESVSIYLRSFVAKLVIVSVLSVMLFDSVWATNGYFSHGYGTQSKGMAGVGVALPTSSLTAATNPAGMFFVGNRYDIGLAIFNPNRQYTVTNTSNAPNNFPLAPGTQESDSKLFVIPAAGANWMINDVSSVGVSIYGNGGMNTDYDTKTYDNPQAPVTKPTGVNFSQLFIGATYARSVVENHVLGITGILAYQMFSADGLQAFGGFSSDPSKLTNNDTDSAIGIGLKLGYMGYVLPNLSIGAAYQPKTFMGEFDEYAGLFAEKGDFDIPSNWTIGLAYSPIETVTLGFDIQQIDYSETKSVGNKMNPGNIVSPDNPTGTKLGDDDGPGFGWEDMTVLKFGGHWNCYDTWVLRAGYSFGEQPIPASEMLFNIISPGVIEQHLSIGASKMIGEREVSIAITRALTGNADGPNPMGPTAQSIELEMDQWDIEIGFSF